MTLSVVSPRSRSIPAPSERNGLKELTAWEGVVSTTMFWGGALRCARADAGSRSAVAHKVHKAPGMAGHLIEITCMSSACLPGNATGSPESRRDEQYNGN